MKNSTILSATFFIALSLNLNAAEEKRNTDNKTIQQILNICDIIEETTGSRPSNAIHHDGIKALQTTQGISLMLAYPFIPNFIQTPFGRFEVGEITDEAFEILKKRLGLKFLYNNCEEDRRRYTPMGIDLEKTEFWKGKKNDWTNPINNISKAELDQYRGTDTRIRASWCGCASVYGISKADDQELPEAIERPGKDCASYKKAKRAWKAKIQEFLPPAGTK